MKKDLPDTLTIPQAAEALGVSRQNIWHAIQRGRIQALRFGHVALIPRSALEEYVATKSKGGRPRKENLLTKKKL
jgi:excisionase family DNA binding protein